MGSLGLLIAAVGLSGLVGNSFAGHWLSSVQAKAATWMFHLTQRESWAMAARFVVAAGWIVLVPTFLLGAAFPVALRLTAEPAGSGRDTGRVLALNTLGGIAGTLLAGFVLVPRLGLERSLALMSAVAATVGNRRGGQGNIGFPTIAVGRFRLRRLGRRSGESVWGLIIWLAFWPRHVMVTCCSTRPAPPARWPSSSKVRDGIASGDCISRASRIPAIR